MASSGITCPAFIISKGTAKVHIFFQIQRIFHLINNKKLHIMEKTIIENGNNTLILTDEIKSQLAAAQNEDRVGTFMDILDQVGDLILDDRNFADPSDILGGPERQKHVIVELRHIRDLLATIREPRRIEFDTELLRRGYLNTNRPLP